MSMQENDMDIVLKEMAPEEIWMIEQVNRSERVEAKYFGLQSDDGRGLTLRRVELDPPEENGPWTREGIDQRTAEWKLQIENGGLLLGALRGPRLIGFAALGGKVPDGYAELLALFVDTDHRRAGIGSSLMMEIERRARAMGIHSLWIASNRTASSVEFYLKQGYKIITLSDNARITHLGTGPRFIKEL